jgi:predicted nuclease of restriction endonuclease-like (RecB) superfamily
MKLDHYASLLDQIKARIQSSQTRAVLSVNRELLNLYWEVGRVIHERQQKEGWGKAIIPRLSRDLRNELPEVKGFSERNLGRMIRFYNEYPDLFRILPAGNAGAADAGARPVLPQPVAKTEDSTSSISLALAEAAIALPWGHNFLLLEKLKYLPTRLWYMRQTLEHGWSRNVLALMVDGRAHERQGKATTNFALRLPSPQSDLAQQALKDPYIFDFLTLAEAFRERELETGLVAHLERFLLELGRGFAFLGRQYKVSVGADDFYIDLLFSESE